MTTVAGSVKTRSEIPADHKWNVEALYPSLEAWESAFTAIAANNSPPFFPKLATFKGKLHEGASTLKEALEYQFSCSRELEKLYTFAHLRHDEEITQAPFKSAYEKSTALFHAFGQEAAFLEPEILALPQEVIDSYLKDPLLEPYRFHLEKIFHLRAHTLSADKEELLAMMGKAEETAAKAFSALNNADIKFLPVTDSEEQKHPLSHGLYQLYLRSSDETLRKNAFKTMHGQYAAHENTLCELLQGQMQNHLFSAKARGYASCLDQALYPKNIPLSVYHSLIQAVRNCLPTLHRYTRLRKKVMGVDKLNLYDMYVPMVSQVDIRVDYPEAEELVIESAAPLGSNYQSLLQEGLKKQRWVDRYENQNKRSGAYSSGCFDSFPYILMNFRGILRDTFTLAHEAGHSMHSLLSRNTQPYHYSHYPIFVAEVASTFNEELLTQLLLKKFAKPEERLFLINEKMEDIRATLFRQAMFAEFELILHELVEKGTPLTPPLLKELYLKLNADYFGPDVVVNEDISIEWGRIPHFYYNFYVYQYATGISAALALVDKVTSGAEGSLEKYLNFLSAGGSRYPIELLQLAGVDMTTPAPVEAAIQKFESLVADFEHSFFQSST